jgi:hypothetical protein
MHSKNNDGGSGTGDKRCFAISTGFAAAYADTSLRIRNPPTIIFRYQN